MGYSVVPRLGKQPLAKEYYKAAEDNPDTAINI